jgi:hypothetical protein
MAVVAIFAPPEGVYIYDGERPVALFGDLYFPGPSPVVDEFVRLEKLAPPAPHLWGSYLPRTRRHSIGSWDVGVLGQGQTMSGWNTLSSRPTSCVSQPLVSLSTISRISESASFIFSSFTRGMHASAHTASILGYSPERAEGASVLKNSFALISAPVSEAENGVLVVFWP